MICDKNFNDNPPLIIFKGSQNTIFLEEAVKMMQSFEIKDAKTIILLQYAQLNNLV